MDTVEEDTSKIIFLQIESCFFPAPPASFTSIPTPSGQHPVRRDLLPGIRRRVTRGRHELEQARFYVNSLSINAQAAFD